MRPYATSEQVGRDTTLARRLNTRNVQIIFLHVLLIDHNERREVERGRQVVFGERRQPLFVKQRHFITKNAIRSQDEKASRNIIRRLQQLCQVRCCLDEPRNIPPDSRLELRADTWQENAFRVTYDNFNR